MKLLSFRQYHLDETAKDHTYAQAQTGIDSKSLSNPARRQALNAAIHKATAFGFITPYIGYGAVMRILAYGNIILPQHIFFNKEEGQVVLEIAQFGDVHGAELDGRVADRNQPKLFVYFSYQMNPKDGYYDVEACLADEEELEEILHTDLDGDNEEGESPEHKALVKEEEEGHNVYKAQHPLPNLNRAGPTHAIHTERSNVVEPKGYSVTRPSPGVHSVTHNASKTKIGHIETLPQNHPQRQHGHEVAAHHFHNQRDDESPVSHHASIQRAVDHLAASHKAHGITKPDTKEKDEHPEMGTVREHRLDEVSKKLVTRYATKVGNDKKLLNHVRKNFGRLDPKNGPEDRKTLNRLRGSSNAVNKLLGQARVNATREEPLDEVSKGKLERYSRKVINDKELTTHVRKNFGHLDPKKSDKDRKALNRLQGSQTAIKKTLGQAKVNATEEPLDEISKKKIADYLPHAVASLGKHEFQGGYHQGKADQKQSGGKLVFGGKSKPAEDNLVKGVRRARGIDTALRKTNPASFLKGAKVPATEEDSKKKIIDESIRHLETHMHGVHTAKVYRDNGYQEYRVKYYTNGRHHVDADSHHDDEADAHDTAKHQLKRMHEYPIKEEPLTELSKHTLSSYTKASAKSAQSSPAKSKTFAKRVTGMARAAWKLKEEPLDELSHSTLKRYKIRAGTEVHDISHANPKTKEEKEKLEKKFAHRVAGVHKVKEKLDETLPSDATAGDWIHDFVHSSNPKFAGKSKEKRKEMALAAYYAKHEETNDISRTTVENGSLKKETPLPKKYVQEEPTGDSAEEREDKKDTKNLAKKGYKETGGDYFKK